MNINYAIKWFINSPTLNLCLSSSKYLAQKITFQMQNSDKLCKRPKITNNIIKYT